MEPTKYIRFLSMVSIAFIAFAPSLGQAQIFKANKSTAETPETPASAPEAPSKKAQKSRVGLQKVPGVAPKKTSPAPKNSARTPPAATAAPMPQKPESAPRVGDPSLAECDNLSTCLETIREVLSNMSTADELNRLESLTVKAESLLAENDDRPRSGSVEHTEDAEKEAADTGAPQAASDSAETTTETAAQAADPPPVPAVDPEEYASLLERVAALEKEMADVDKNTKTNAARLDARESKGGFKIFGPGDSVLSVGGLLQTRMETIQDGAPNGENWSYGLYIRRMRLMFYGQLTKWLNFFIETEQANFGLNGDWGGRVFIQDAYVEFNLHPAVQVDVGMMLPLLSRHAMQGATTLMGMDYHSVLVKYPAGSTMVWRDIGVQVRGLTLNDRLEYRLGLWSGVHGSGSDPRNPKDLPRLSGHLTANVFDSEGGAGVGGMFYDGLYLKKEGDRVVSTKTVLSFGASFDWQPDLNVELAARDPNGDPNAPDAPISYSDYFALAGDVFWDIPFGANNLMSANGQMNLYYYDHGDRRTSKGSWYYNAASNTLNYSGWGLFGEYGVRYSMFQALFSFDVYEAVASDGDAGDYLNFSGGLNYFLSAHAVTFKFLSGADRVADGDWKAAVKFQLQLVF